LEKSEISVSARRTSRISRFSGSIGKWSYYASARGSLRIYAKRNPAGHEEPCHGHWHEVFDGAEVAELLLSRSIFSILLIKAYSQTENRFVPLKRKRYTLILDGNQQLTINREVRLRSEVSVQCRLIAPTLALTEREPALQE
jgi:hypothetical protein